MVDSYKVGNFLIELRNEKHLTQAQVADALNLSVKTISKWECGSGLPSIDYLPELASFYGVSVDEILNGERKHEEKVATKSISPTVNHILCLCSVILSVLALLVSLIVSLTTCNGIAYIIILIVFSLISLACVGISYSLNNKYRSTLFNCATCLLVSDLTMIIFSFFFVSDFSSNVALLNKLLIGLFILSLIPSFVYFMYSTIKKTSFKETIAWNKFMPIVLCTAFAVIALMNTAIYLYTPSSDVSPYEASFTIDTLIFCVGAISSFFAIFFKKYRIVNDWISLALAPICFMLIAILANEFPLYIIACFAYLCVYSIFDIVYYFVGKKKAKQTDTNSEQNVNDVH